MGSVVDITDARRRGLNSGDGGGTFDDMDRRIKVLEDDMKKILQDTAEIKGMLRAAPSAIEFGELKGRVNALPTTAKIATIVSIVGGVVAIALKWQDITVAVASIASKH